MRYKMNLKEMDDRMTSIEKNYIEYGNALEGLIVGEEAVITVEDSIPEKKEAVEAEINRLKMVILSGMGDTISKRLRAQVKTEKRKKDALNKANYEKMMKKMNKKQRPKTYKVIEA